MLRREDPLRNLDPCDRIEVLIEELSVVLNVILRLFHFSARIQWCSAKQPFDAGRVKVLLRRSAYVLFPLGKVNLLHNFQR